MVSSETCSSEGNNGKLKAPLGASSIWSKTPAGEMMGDYSAGIRFNIYNRDWNSWRVSIRRHGNSDNDPPSRFNAAPGDLRAALLKTDTRTVNYILDKREIPRLMRPCECSAGG